MYPQLQSCLCVGALRIFRGCTGYSFGLAVGFTAGLVMVGLAMGGEESATTETEVIGSVTIVDPCRERDFETEF